MLHVADISVDEGVEITIAPERTICSISVPRAEMVAEGDEAEEPELVGEDDAAPEGEASGGGDTGGDEG